MSAPIRTVTLKRSFAAPRDLVFRMWTEEKHLAAWWGPRHFTTPECHADARPGGKIALRMSGLGFDSPMDGEYIEIDPPKRLVFTSLAMKDAAGNHQLR